MGSDNFCVDWYCKDRECHCNGDCKQFSCSECKCKNIYKKPIYPDW